MPLKFDPETLREILTAAWRRRYLIATPIAILPVLAFIVGLLSPKAYETRMTILVEEGSRLNPFLQDLAVSTNLKERMEALLALLRSRHILSAVTDELQLVPPGAGDAARESRIQTLAQEVSGRQLGKDLIELRYRSLKPAGMDKVLDSIAHRFVDRIRAPALSSIESSETFLSTQLSTRRHELEAAEAAMAAFKDRHSDALPALHEANVTRLAQLRTQLADRETELAGAEAAFQQVRTQLAQANPIIGRLEEKIVNLTGELALLRARYTDEHSRVQGVVRQLERLTEERAKLLEKAHQFDASDSNRLRDLARALDNSRDGGPQPLLVSQIEQLQNAETRVTALKRETERLSRLIADGEERVRGFGGIERELSTLERDVRLKREVFEGLLKRFEMARITGDLGRFETPEQIKVIDRPVVPTRPITPPPFIFALAGLVGGIVLGAGLAAAAELFDPTARSTPAIERLTGAPVLARLQAFTS